MTAIDDAANDAERKRREALDAMARSGSAGIDAYKEAQAQVSGYRDTALNQALGAASRRGASAAATGELETIIRQPGDRTLQHLAAAQGTFAADMARRATANTDYFDQAKAAVPAIQAASARDIAWAKSQWEAQKAKEAKAKEDSEGEQKKIAQGLAEMAAESARAQRVPTARMHNPTYDPVGAQLLLLSGGGTPEQRAQAEQVLANPSAGATYLDPISGTEQPVEPGLPETHYVGTSTDYAKDLAAEIAAATPSPDIQRQRDAYTQVYGDDLRSQALSRGIFPTPTPAQQLTQQGTQDAVGFYNQFGVQPTAAQLQTWARGQDPFAAQSKKPQMSPAEAAAQVSKTPDKVLNVTAVTQDEDGNEVTVNVYETVAGFMEHYLKQGYSPDQAAERVAQDIAKSAEEGGFGRDYPAVRATVALVYGGSGG